MIESKGSDYQSSEFAQAAMVAEAKVGKSTFLISQALGVFPGQKHGGVIDRPSNLHVIAADAGAATGVKRFLTETCGAPKEALDFNIFNIQDDVRRVSLSEEDWDYTLYNTIVTCIKKIQERAAKGGTHVVIVSSLTGIAQALERGLAGPPGAKKGAGMDQSKWAAFAHQLTEIRNLVQSGNWHTFWEGHIYKPAPTGQNQEAQPETLQISGKSAHGFLVNVEQIFRIRRNFGQTVGDTNCDLVYLDTRPALDFIANGRGFTESLDPKEKDVVVAFHKLKLKLGFWGRKKK